MRNYAISNAIKSSRYILFINNDVEAIERGWLERLRSVANRPDVGVVGATLLFKDRGIQHAGVIVGLNGAAYNAHRSAPHTNASTVRNPGYLASLFLLGITPP